MTRFDLLLLLLPLVVAVNKERLEQIRLLHGHDGIDTATVHVAYAHSPSSPRRLTKREARENLLTRRHDNLAVTVTLTSTGHVLDLRLRPSGLQMQGALVKVRHEEGQVSEFKVEDRGCHYHGTFDGGDGAASVHFCDGVMIGAGHGKNIEYHFHSHSHRLPHELDNDDNNNNNNDNSDNNNNNNNSSDSVDHDDPLGLRSDYGWDLYHALVSWKSSSDDDDWRVDDDGDVENLASTHDYMEIDEDVNDDADEEEEEEEKEEEEGEKKKDDISRIRRQAIPSTTPSDYVDGEDSYDPEADIDVPVTDDPANDEPSQEYQAEQVPVIEMGIIVDEEFLTENRHIYPTHQAIVNMLMVKYTGVQALYGNPKKTGLNMTIKIKLVYLWYQNPPGYNGSKDKLGRRMRAGRIMNTLDPMYLKTDVGAVYTVKNNSQGYLGIAAVGGACRKNFKTIGIRVGQLLWRVEAHELGHVLGLAHNPPLCVNATPPYDKGFMNKVVLRFLPCYGQQIIKRLKTKGFRCFYNEGVTIPNVPPQRFQATFPVLSFGLNFYCQTDFRNDSLFAFQDQSKPCGDTVCAITDWDNPDYGMSQVSRAFDGLACGPHREICLMGKCRNPGDFSTSMAVLDTVTGSSTWKPWTAWDNKCTSACGAGVQISTRQCRNPDRAEACSGPRYRARLCNTQSCPGDDLMGELDIRRDRANYTCSLLHARGGNHAQYLYPYAKNISEKVLTTPINSKSCMVFCETTPRPPDSPRFQNGFGTVMQADGTTCGPLNDIGLWRRRVLGIITRCLRGRCLEFGCDGYSMESRAEGKVVDMCGVCGGDNSTCSSGQVAVRLAKTHPMHLLVELPAGTTDIVFAVVPEKSGKFSLARLALADKDNSNVIMPGSRGRTRIFSNVDNPLTFAGTHWTVVNNAVMSAPGPTDQPMKINVKVMRSATPVNAVIVYGYKLPERVPPPPACENGGVVNFTNGGCMCSGRYHGKMCEYGCHNLCYNGGQLTNRCGCDCTDNNRTVNSAGCLCLEGFAGPDCSQCAIPQCFNGGTLDSGSCRCQCPAECGGKPDCSDCSYNPLLLPNYRGHYGRGSLEDPLVVTTSGDQQVIQRPTQPTTTAVNLTSGGQATFTTKTVTTTSIITTATTLRPVSTTVTGVIVALCCSCLLHRLPFF